MTNHKLAFPVAGLVAYLCQLKKPLLNIKATI